MPNPPVKVHIQGGSEDDRAFAKLALGLDASERLLPQERLRALAAVEATDRFRKATLDFSSEGATLSLEPWPRLSAVRIEGMPPGFPHPLPGSLRKGAMPGPRRLADACARVATFLRERGYPDALVDVARLDGDRVLVFQVAPGRARVIQGVRFEGHLGPYTPETLQRVLALRPGRTLWHDPFRLGAAARLRRRFVADDRCEGHADLIWDDSAGTLTVRVEAGPRVDLRLEGKGLSLRRVKRVLPLLQSERHSPDLLDQGDRRILRLLLSEGHLDARVTHRREVLQGSPTMPESVAITYVLEPGPAYVLKGLQFRRNQDLTTETLHQAMSIPRTWYLLGDPNATPDLLDGLEEKLKDTYRRRGYADISVRRLPPQKQGVDATAVFDIREGPLRLIRHVVLEVPKGMPAPLPLAATLVAILRDRPEPLQDLPKTFRTDRTDSDLPPGTLREIPAEAVRRFVLSFDRAVPFVRTELARMLNLLRQRVLATGVQRPRMQLAFDPWEGAPAVRITLEDDARVSVRRLVVQGADATRARAVLRENSLAPGAPLDPDRLSRTQAALGGLGGFQYVDLGGLADTASETPWEEGDLLAQLEERSPWVISHALGYDKSQGYHLGLGVQRLNLAGMGRTLDLGIRAGDGTLQNPTLRKLFPTGPNPRSVDMYSLGYSDPRADAALPGSWLPQNTRYRLEGAYIQEQRDTFLLRRRRLLNGFDWQKTPTDGSPWQYQTGVRYEHVTVASAIPGIREDELNAIARMPPKVTIVAPYFQAVRDRRDNPVDPTEGSIFRGRMELANQLWGTSPNSSFVKLDLSQQWHWPLGPRAVWGVASMSMRLGLARPTDASARDLPLSERFFAGGPFTHRGVEPDWLGWDLRDQVPVRSSTPPFDPLPDPGDPSKPLTQPVPVGGQGLVLLSLEAKFPLYKRAIWGELFVDSGQVQRSFFPEPGEARFRPLRTAVGVGIIAKVGLPIKAEYAWDLKRLLGRPLSPAEKATRLKNVLLSAGFQF